MTEIRDVIQHIREAKDPFDSAKPEDIQGRKDAAKNAQAKIDKKMIDAWKLDHPGRTPPSCPHCGVSFLNRDNTIIVDAVVSQTELWYFDAQYNGWEYIEAQDTDSAERDSAICDQCGGDLKMGTDVEL